jgi:hypothetical protein
VALAAQALSFFATSLALRVLQPLLQLAARSLRRAATQFTRSTQAARLKLSAVAERSNTLSLLAVAREVVIGLVAVAVVVIGKTSAKPQLVLTP